MEVSDCVPVRQLLWESKKLHELYPAPNLSFDLEIRENIPLPLTKQNLDHRDGIVILPASLLCVVAVQVGLDRLDLFEIYAVRYAGEMVSNAFNFFVESG